MSKIAQIVQLFKKKKGPLQMEELWETAYFLFIYVTGTENKSSFKLNCAETLIIAGRCVMAQHSVLKKRLMF